MKVQLGAGLVIAALAAAQGAFAQAPLIEAGAEVYQANCAECHGEGLRSTGAAFDLRQLAADERPRFNQSVNDGKGQMPAFGGMLSTDEMEQLWAYVRSKAN
jgi:cytochrome c6